ncbi:MAG: hypothetical protein AAGF88_09785 [Pseudomonadota bacterium]
MNFRLFTASVVIAAALAPPGQAQLVLCSLNPNSPTALMPPDLTIELDGAQATVAHSWEDGPLFHDVSVTDNGDRKQMTFTLPFNVNARTAMVHYTLTFFLSRQQLSIVAAAGAGFEGNFRGRYSCAPLE